MLITAREVYSRKSHKECLHVELKVLVSRESCIVTIEYISCDILNYEYISSTVVACYQSQVIICHMPLVL